VDWSDKWVDMDFKNEKLIQKFGFRVKADPTQKTHRPTSVMFFEENNKDFAI
jgi:hypothetical protein